MCKIIVCICSFWTITSPSVLLRFPSDHQSILIRPHQKQTRYIIPASRVMSAHILQTIYALNIHLPASRTRGVFITNLPYLNRFHTSLLLVEAPGIAPGSCIALSPPQRNNLIYPLYLKLCQQLIFFLPHCPSAPCNTCVSSPCSKRSEK
jgi:hypothetical protein